MRISPAAVLVAVGVLLAPLSVVGCTTQVNGTPHADPAQPGLALSDDKFGIAAGFDDAPKRIEIFTEPQCSHCADLQADFGDQLAYYIRIGALKVTYRTLIFMDPDSAAKGYSARVSNALFLAAQGGATGTQFQHFVQELWSHQDPFGPPPTNDALADRAKAAGMSDDVVKRIAGGGSAVDIKAMDDNNFEYLLEIDSEAAGTPTVYDPVADKKIDIFDNDWLNKVIQS